MATKNKKHLLRGDLAIVEWYDACSQDEWKESGEIDLSPEPVVSAGIVFEHNEEKITLALNHDCSNDSYSCLITIPIGMVSSIRKIRYDKAKVI
jgi:hypothetical protein